MRLQDRIRSESGELAVLFSGVLVLLLILIGISTDFILYSNKKDKLNEVAYLIKDTRFDLAEPLFNSTNPQQTLEEIAHMLAVQNQIDPTSVSVEWRELKKPTLDHKLRSDQEGSFIVGKRKADTLINISETYDPIFLKMFNVKEIPIEIIIEDSLEKDTEQGYVWVPYK